MPMSYLQPPGRTKLRLHATFVFVGIFCQQWDIFSWDEAIKRGVDYCCGVLDFILKS